MRKAYHANLWTLVLARDTAQAEELDDLLWDMGEDEYIPHQIAGRDDEDDVTPVLIADPQTGTPMRPLVLNLRDAPVAGDFERVLEVVPADESARGCCASAGSTTAQGLEPTSTTCGAASAATRRPVSGQPARRDAPPTTRPP